MDAYSLGQAAVLLAKSRGEKQAADAPETVHALKGKLMLSGSGWILLSVPNAFARGAFDALGEPGTELPPGADGKAFNAHISVIRPEEMEEHNIDPETIVERGHEFTYTTGAVKTVKPAGWSDMSTVWFLEVKSPSLENLRKSYGLTARPKNNQHEFHISFAVRKRNVLRENDIAVGRVSQSLIHRPGLFPDEFQRQKAAAATAGTVLGQLRQAKMHSDRRDYSSKHQILKHLLRNHPDEFEVDNPTGKYHGLTHKSSGFRIHAPAWLVPVSMKGEKVAEAQPPPNWWALSQLLDKCGVQQKEAALLPGVQPLQPHQQAIADTAHDHVRMLLYHSLGSGKTRTALTGAETADEPYTAVMPASLRGNFRKEQEKWTDQKLPSNLLSYNALAQSVPDTAPGTVIFDEAHRLRNPSSLQTQHAFELSDKANRTYLLSGSPVVNHPHDLAPLMRMVTGNEISPEEFDNKFVGERTISPSLWGWLQGAESVTQPAMINHEQFRDAWDGHVSYHAPAKPDVQQNEEHYNVPMSTDQHRLYNAFWDKLPALLRWKLQSSFPLSHSELLKLNSFLAGPRQVSLSTFPFMRGQGDAFQAYQQSPKLQKAVGFMTEAHKDPNFRGVAYSNFVNAGLVPYAAALTNAGIPHGIFHGGLNDATRKKVVDDYNSGRTRVLLLGPSGGEGISLKGTRMLQILDPHWNSTRTTQAIGRGVRFDSHTDLPEDQRNVRVQHFNSELPPGLWQQMWNWVTNAKPAPPEQATPSINPGVDTYLQQMGKRKDRLNQEFLDELRTIGTKAAAARALRQICYQGG